MLSNQDIQNNWTTIKSGVLSKWNKLSATEVEKTHGDIDSLGKLVQTKYDNNKEEFETAYNKICKNSKSTNSSKTEGTPDFENRSETAPAAEAGMSAPNSTGTDDTFHSGSAERRANANFSKIENEFANKESKTEDELVENPTSSRASKNINLNNKESNTHFSAPGDFKNSQDLSTSGEDISLGRTNSSATKLSTAQAASKSSAASNDVKKRI